VSVHTVLTAQLHMSPRESMYATSPAGFFGASSFVKDTSNPVAPSFIQASLEDGAVLRTGPLKFPKTPLSLGLLERPRDS